MSAAPPPGAPSKLARLRNWQSHEFWARLFARPLCILFLYPVADLRWVTPNRLTHFANLVFAAGIACLWTGHWLWAAALVNLHLVVDNMDGTLARYRSSGTVFGSYYDKISDYLGICTMFLSLGWLSGDPRALLAASVLCLAETIGGYSKWLTEALTLRKMGPPAPARGGAAGGPPRRTPGQWLLWFLDSLWRIVLFEEVDYFFWVGIALATGRLDWVLYLLCATRVIGLLGTLAWRGRQLHRLDQPA